MCVHVDLFPAHVFLRHWSLFFNIFLFLFLSISAVLLISLSSSILSHFCLNLLWISLGSFSFHCTFQFQNVYFRWSVYWYFHRIHTWLPGFLHIFFSSLSFYDSCFISSVIFRGYFLLIFGLLWMGHTFLFLCLTSDFLFKTTHLSVTMWELEIRSPSLLGIAAFVTNVCVSLNFS